MGMFEAIGHFWLERLMAWEAVVDKARDKVNTNTPYLIQDAFDDVLKVWIGDIDGWLRLFPGGKPPILFGLTNAGTANWDDAIVIGPFTPTTSTSLKVTSPLIALKGSGTGTVTKTHITAEAKIKFTVTGMSGLATGDAYLSVCYDELGAGKMAGVAVLVLGVR